MRMRRRRGVEPCCRNRSDREWRCTGQRRGGSDRLGNWVTLGNCVTRSIGVCSPVGDRGTCSRQSGFGHRPAVRASRTHYLTFDTSRPSRPRCLSPSLPFLGLEHCSGVGLARIVIHVPKRKAHPGLLQTFALWGSLPLRSVRRVRLSTIEGTVLFRRVEEHLEPCTSVETVREHHASLRVSSG